MHRRVSASSLGLVFGPHLTVGYGLRPLQAAGYALVRPSSMGGWLRDSQARSCCGNVGGRFGHQVRQADQVVGGGDEVTRQTGPVDAPIPGAPESTDGLHPTKDLLNPLADPLAHAIAGMPGGSSINRAAPTTGVLSNVRRDPAGSRRFFARSKSSGTASRSAVPVASDTWKSTSIPFRFSIRAWPMNTSFASFPLPLRSRRASGSVVLSCVAFERFSPWKSTDGLPGSSSVLWGGSPSRGLKLFRLAAASISVPSTVKCSSESKPRLWASPRT